MSISKNFKYHAVGIVAGGLVLAGGVAAFTPIGPDFTDISKDAQKFQDNLDFYERSYMDGDFINAIIPKRDVDCPHGYEIDEDDWDSPLHVASWSTAYPQEDSSSLTLRFYKVGQCQKDVDGAEHIVSFDMTYLADYNAYTEDQILSAEFEDGSRIGEIVVQKESDGPRWLIPAYRTATLNEETRVFNDQDLYVTLENFRVRDGLRYRAPEVTPSQ